MDLRERVMAAYGSGRQTKEIAGTFDVSPAWARRLKQHKRGRGDIIPRTGGGGQTPKVDPVRLQELVDQKPDATLAELRESLKVDCALWTICKALRRLKLTYKKSRSTPPSGIARMSPFVARSGRRCRPGSILPA
jgi:transposase